MNKVLAGFLFISLLRSANPAWAQDLEIHFLDVHQGDSTLIVCPNGNRILVDAGDSRFVPGGKLNQKQIADRKKYLTDKLRSRNRLEYLVITHADMDHYRLLDDFLSDVTVNTIVYGGAYEEYSNGFKEWLSSKPEGLLVSPTGSDLAREANRYFDCGSAKVWILASNIPHTNCKWKKNTQSLVLKISYGKFDAILTGDATFETEAAILDFYDDEFLDVELMKLGHHGSHTTSTGENWVRATKPEIAVASATRGTRNPKKKQGNQYGHMGKKVFDRVRPCTSNVPAHSVIFCRRGFDCKDKGNETRAVYSTASSGTIVVKSDGSGWKVSENGKNFHTPSATDTSQCGIN